MNGLKAAPVKIMWHPGLPIFSSEAFLKVVGDEYGWLGGFADSGTLRCALPYTVIKKASFRIVRFRVETIPFGEKVELAEEKVFLNSAVEYFRSLGADLIVPATNNTIFRTFPDGAVVAPYGSYVIDLNNSEDTLWSNLHPKHRNVIRNATKRGVQIRSGLEFESIAYELVRDTLKRSKLGFMPYDEFQRLIQSFHGNVKINIVKKLNFTSKIIELNTYREMSLK